MNHKAILISHLLFFSYIYVIAFEYLKLRSFIFLKFRKKSLHFYLFQYCLLTFLTFPVLYFFELKTLSIAGLWFAFLIHLTLLKGEFNGGSDYMAILVASALLLLQILPEKMAKLPLTYLCFQLIAAYFLAGLVKIKSTEWRQGKTLLMLIDSVHFNPHPAFIRFISIPGLSLTLGFMAIGFDLMFPLSLNTAFTIPILFIGVFFHFFNFLFFGLNRFFFIFLSAYPLLYFYLMILSTPPN